MPDNDWPAIRERLEARAESLERQAIHSFGEKNAAQSYDWLCASDLRAAVSRADRVEATVQALEHEAVHFDAQAEEHIYASAARQFCKGKAVAFRTAVETIRQALKDPHA